MMMDEGRMMGEWDGGWENDGSMGGWEDDGMMV